MRDLSLLQSDPHKAPVEEVEEDERCWEEDSTALVDPLCDLLRRHRGEASVGVAGVVGL